jgi:hypothetical protein
VDVKEVAKALCAGAVAGWTAGYEEFQRRMEPELPIPPPGRRWVVADHNTLGDNIVYDGVEDGQRRLHGWTTPRPDLYDEFVLRMQSGRRAVFIVSGVQHCHDPADMWFARTPMEGKYLEEGTPCQATT